LLAIVRENKTLFHGSHKNTWKNHYTVCYSPWSANRQNGKFRRVIFIF